MSSTSSSTPLSSYHFAFWDVVLEEVFLVSPADITRFPQDACISDLAKVSGLSAEEIAERLEETEHLQSGIAISEAELKKKKHEDGDLLFLDVGEPLDEKRWPHALRLHEHPWERVLPPLQQAPVIVTVCQEARRAYSAAMALRTRGFPAFFLSPLA